MWEARHGEESGPKWRGFGVVQEVFGSCAVPSGAEADGPLQARTNSRKSVGEMLKIVEIEEGRVPDRNAKG